MRNVVAFIMVIACAPAEPPVAPKSPSSPATPSHLEAGKAAMSRLDYRAAVDELSLAIAADPADGSAFAQRGKAYSALGDFKRAIDDFTVALRSTTSAELYVSRGSAYCSLQDRERGLADLAEAKAAATDDAAIDQRIVECKRLRTEAERTVDGAMDEIAQEARQTFAAGEMERARDLARIVLRHNKGDEAMLRIAAMASCKLGDRLFAPRYFAKLSVAKDRDDVTAACAEARITLQGPSARLP